MENEKLVKALGRDTVDEMDTLREEDLMRVIVEATGAMRTAKDELDANKEYQKAKADCSLLSSGKREVDKRQKARIAYSQNRLAELGKMDFAERHTWDRLRNDKIKELEARRAAKAREAAEQAPSPVRLIKGEDLDAQADALLAAADKLIDGGDDAEEAQS